MRVASLTWLACPAPGCAGELSVAPSVPPKWGDAGQSELLEGILACGSCEAEYPVILGAAILVPQQHRYLWAFWNEIERCEKEAGAEISHTMRSYLGVSAAYIGRAEPDDPWDQSLDWTTSPYVQAHFDAESLTDGIPPGWWQDAVSRFGHESTDPYRYLLSTARGIKGQAGDGLAVEVGASVGRTAADLAGDYRYCIGLDWSFRAVLSARRLLLSQPSRQETYPLEGERGDLVERELRPVRSPDNLDYVVADGAALPFAQGGTACVAALNVLCAVTTPKQLVDELCRVAAPGGLLLVSSPYWSDTEPGLQKSRLALSGPGDTRAALESCFEILAEQDMVPWLLRLAKRRWNVYLCHCLIAARRQPPGSFDKSS
jgi:SAM-dependent methyltransferase